MNESDATKKPPIRLLPEFEPLSILWTGEDAPFQSEQAARWALRMHRARFIEARAIAYWRGQMLVHPERFAAAVQELAIAGARRGMVPFAG